jgi:hypothetical protein
MTADAAGSAHVKVDKDRFFKEIGYVPHAEQLKFHCSLARFRVAVCGRRFGKSTMASRDLEPHLFLPKKRFWIVGPTYDLAEKEFRVVWDDLIINKQLGRNRKVKKAYNKKQGDMYIEFPWGTRLEARSADHPENLVGEALDGVILSEAAKQKTETWERFLRPALADNRGFATFPTTPEGFNWVHKLYQLGKHPDHKNWESWRFPSWANTVIYPGGRQDPEILEIESTTIPDWFDQEIAALFTAFVGKIYGEFDEETHVERVEYDPALPNYIAFDWGFVNPMAAVEFQVTPRDEIRIWREHYKTYTTLNDFLAEMKAREQPEGYKINLCFGDAADPQAIETVNKEFAPCIGDPRAKENWREGVMLVKKFMQLRDTGLVSDEYGTPIMRPGLVVDHDCTWFIHETNNYKTKKMPKGNNAPEGDEKKENHTLDAIRYGLVHLYIVGVNYHLSDVADVNGLGLTARAMPSGGSIITSTGVGDSAGSSGSDIDPFAGIFTMEGRF